MRVYSANMHMCHVFQCNISSVLFFCGYSCCPAASRAQSVHGNIDVDADGQSMNRARCPPTWTWVEHPANARPRKGNAEEYSRLERTQCGEKKGKRKGTALTVSCCHQGLELLSFGWRLGPGAGSHCNLGSSGGPVERRTVNTSVLCSVGICLTPCFDSWRFMM